MKKFLPLALAIFVLLNSCSEDSTTEEQQPVINLSEFPLLVVYDYLGLPGTNDFEIEYDGNKITKVNNLIFNYEDDLLSEIVHESEYADHIIEIYTFEYENRVIKTFYKQNYRQNFPQEIFKYDVTFVDNKIHVQEYVSHDPTSNYYQFNGLFTMNKSGENIALTEQEPAAYIQGHDYTYGTSDSPFSGVQNFQELQLISMFENLTKHDFLAFFEVVSPGKKNVTTTNEYWNPNGSAITYHYEYQYDNDKLISIDILTSIEYGHIDFFYE